MPVIGTIRGRTLLASLALLALLGSVILLAVIGTSRYTREQQALEQRAVTVAAVENARAQVYLAGTLIAAAALAEDPHPLIDSYRETMAAAMASIQEARLNLTAQGDTDILASLDKAQEQGLQVTAVVDEFITILLQDDRDAARAAAIEYEPKVWPVASAALQDLGDVAQAEQDRLAAQSLDANHQANLSLWLMIGLGTIGFLIALLVVATLVGSVLRPLASLQQSVRAVMSGEIAAAADVSGPQEMTSLARDFNEMVQRQRRAADEMTHRLDVESAVAQTSRVLVAADSIDDGLNASLEILAQAVGANHAFIFMLRDNNTRMDNSHEWCAPGIRFQRHKFQDLECARFPWLMEKLARNEAIVVADVAAAPEEAAAARDIFLQQRVKSVLGVPLGNPPNPFGILGFDDTRSTRDWCNEDVRLLRLASESMSSFVERKRTEQALRESDERYRTLFDRSMDAVYVHDFDGKFLDMNTPSLRSLGYTREDLANLHLTDVMDLAEAQKAFALVDELRRSGRVPRVSAFRLRRKDGSLMDVELTAAIVQRDGQPIAVQGVSRDVTARKQAEAALRESEERFRTLSASAPVGIFLTDAEGQSVYVNDRLLSLIGFDPELARGLNWCQAVHPDDRERVIREKESANAQQSEFRQDFRIVTPDGDVRWVSVRSGPIFGADGNLTGRVGTLEDVTERRTADEERRNAFESTTILLAMVAEARDPYTENHLHRIRHYTEAIALELGLSPDEAQEIGLAALLHDLGKTRVPDAILTKPGPLSEQEWRVMKKHTVWGEELLPSDPWFKTAREIARWHHEHWDGGGYPDGLRQDMIPLAPAIVAVADGFDAMTSRRPYKGPWPPVRAMREISKQRGRQYSPEVVDAFQRAVDKGEIARIASTRISKLSDLTKAA